MSRIFKRNRPITGPRTFRVVTVGEDNLPTNVAVMRDTMPDGSVIEARVVFTPSELSLKHIMEK